MNVSQFNANPVKAKSTLILIGGVVLIVILAVFLVKTFGGIGKAFRGITDGLGITDSDETKKFDDAVKDAKEKSALAGSPWNANYYKSAPTGARLFTVASANALCKIIWDANGFFSDDSEAVLGAIKQCKAKTQVSFLVDRFYIQYKKDLYSWLTQWMTTIQGKPHEELKMISDYVNSLPNT